MVLTLLTGFVLLGGIKRIGAVAEKLVPAMCIGYIVASLVVLAIYAGEIPAAFGLIFESAFTPVAASAASPARPSCWRCATAWRAASSPTRPASAPPDRPGRRPVEEPGAAAAAFGGPQANEVAK